ncbi:ZIP-like iron-zinc transporter [Dacryopinax primogenitus]|uniref:ZIP-like iron-zinc transporter n=1 Tax=Dacryopinax primogenitus (strain DJM 731) TaxID=1858805 RepID=M5G467_DACPD|nr:ZIP-like iron-zinc transporter [Dacryopinax primogenitus]EJU03474.1 ZIP-like iron-zinc transporter [Dacryopinax primogenitus]
MSDGGDDLQCGAVSNDVTYFGLRIGSIFIIMATSMIGALFPVLARKAPWLHVPQQVFDFAKYFGSGIIIATAFIHLLAPAFDELTSPCLQGTWTEYDWAPAIAMISVFMVFLVELFAFRWGTAKLKELGIDYDAHGHEAGPGGHMSAHGPETPREADPEAAAEYADKEGLETGTKVAEHRHGHHASGYGQDTARGGAPTSGAAQILGVAILEFGVIFHSVIIGLTLAVDPNFIQLFIVIIFHQMFEGLGLGTRLAFLDLPRAYRFAPTLGSILYGLVTPIGIAAGLGVSSTYNPGSTTASIVSGILDATSAGVLLYTGLVELLAHEFLFNPDMAVASNGKVLYAVVCMLTGAGVMALLGRWA